VRVVTIFFSYIRRQNTSTRKKRSKHSIPPKIADAPTAYSDDEIIGDRTELYDRVTVTSQNSLTFSFSQSDYGNYTDTSLRDVRRYYGYLIRYATNEDMDDATELHVYHSAAIENKYPDMRKNNLGQQRISG